MRDWFRCLILVLCLVLVLVFGHIEAVAPAPDGIGCCVAPSQPDIRAAFSPFGEISSIDMSFEPLTGKTKGYCFVEYKRQSVRPCKQNKR